MLRGRLPQVHLIRPLHMPAFVQTPGRHDSDVPTSAQFTFAYAAGATKVGLATAALSRAGQASSGRGQWQGSGALRRVQDTRGLASPARGGAMRPIERRTMAVVVVMVEVGGIGGELHRFCVQ